MSRDISRRSGGSLDETFESRLQKTKDLIQENKDDIGGIQLQPMQQLQITNLKKEIEEKEHHIWMMMCICCDVVELLDYLHQKYFVHHQR